MSRLHSLSVPPLDDEDLLQEILLRLPPLPSSLPRASTVCKRWYNILSDPRFLCRFRNHHRKPPLIGFFDKEVGLAPVFTPMLDPPNRIPVSFALPENLLGWTPWASLFVHKSFSFSSCAACVTVAFRNAQQLCAFNRRATMFDDPCILRYSDQDFLANVTDNRGISGAFNAFNVSASAAAAFDAASGRLVNATADYAAADSSRRFGTGEVGFDQTYPKIYSLAQCTPDMSAADCRSCLRDIIVYYTPRYFVGKPGGRIFGVRCSFRFETYPFFSGRPLLQLPGALSPAPAPAAATGEGRTRHRTGLVLAITLPAAAALLLLIASCVCFWRRSKSAERKPAVPYSTNQDDIQSIDSLLLDLSTLRAATDNFAESNKLGEGGFGAVYKGVLSEGGQEIAVKRLSQSSTQGIEELKTELLLVAKLQHKNLVRLVGVCLEEKEKLLVYEYMPNRSLDNILFDSERSRDLDWGKRMKIVNGVARGLQHLHEDSQPRIIHRDLKASNVLLDSDWNPKISDFGLAKLFGWDQSQAVTSHIAGTYGYMAPEYAMRGQYSVKSDAFSFGVLVLEIVTGRKNSSFANSEQSIDLLSLVWEHWTRGTVEELVDPSLGGRSPGGHMLKLINIGLLCVQDNPVDRPTMSTVNARCLCRPRRGQRSASTRWRVSRTCAPPGVASPRRCR